MEKSNKQIKRNMNSLKEQYNKEIVPQLKEKFGYTNNMAVPKLVKVVVNVGTGSAKDKAKKDLIIKSLEAITGQKPASNAARKSIATFKLREGMVIGNSVILRRERMYDFLTRLISGAIPRIRDFRGLETKGIDKMGNFTMGIKEHIVFPEMSDQDVRSAFSLGITIVTTAKTKEEAEDLLKLIGIPFKKKVSK